MMQTTAVQQALQLAQQLAQQNLGQSQVLPKVQPEQDRALPEGSPLLDALTARGNILEMTQQVEEAVLRPLDCGAWPHALRAALAARIASLNALPALASMYLESVDDSAFRSLGDLSVDGRTLQLEHVVAFMDRVAGQTHLVKEADIRLLQERAVLDADIVKLCELNAFMAYQVRLVSGLALLAAATA